jgi:hypothetical protein
MKTLKEFINEVKKPTGDLKKACWDGYTAVGTKQKGGRTVPNCVPEEVELEEGITSVYHKIMSKRAESKADHAFDMGDEKEFAKHVDKAEYHRVKAGGKPTKINTDPDKKSLTYREETELDETAAWQRKEGKNPSGGLNQKGVDSYRRENPGSKLKTAVTTKPSKLKPGSAAANRRKSFCARMSGMKKRLTSAKTANDPDSRINKSLRKWNC